MSEPDADDETGGGRPKIPALEWVLAGVGAVVLLAAFGVLAREGLKESDPVRFGAEVTSLAVRDGHAYAEVTVRNLGGKPAADVMLEAAAAGEVREVTVPFLPGGSERVVGVVLPGGVGPGDVSVTFLTWTEP